jgi:hypothetical protein
MCGVCNVRVCLCGFCNVWMYLWVFYCVDVSVGFVMCGYISGFCNVVDVSGFCNVWMYLCVFVMCGCICVFCHVWMYLWVL